MRNGRPQQNQQQQKKSGKNKTCTQRNQNGGQTGKQANMRGEKHKTWQTRRLSGWPVPAVLPTGCFVFLTAQHRTVISESGGVRGSVESFIPREPCIEYLGAILPMNSGCCFEKAVDSSLRPTTTSLKNLSTDRDTEVGSGYLAGAVLRRERLPQLRPERLPLCPCLCQLQVRRSAGATTKQARHNDRRRARESGIGHQTRMLASHAHRDLLA